MTCAICRADTTLAFFAKGYAHHRCSGCGGIFVHPPPDAAELARFYNSTYQVPPPAPDAPPAPRWVACAAALAAQGVRRVLEIGSSWGHFLAAARQVGMDAQGVEISAEAAAYSRERRGLAVFTGSLAEFSAPAASFDAVVLWHVIEHETDPHGLLSRIRALLAPGGRLAFTTPNAASLAARLAGPGWEWISPPAHVTLFTPDTARRLLTAAGFESVELGARRGDARPLLADLAIAAAKRVLRRDARPVDPTAPRPAVMTRPSRAQERFIALVDGLSAPFAPLGRLLNETLALGPELHVTARKPA